MENLEILQEKFNQEKEKFKLDMQAWNKFQEELSNELNEKMREIFALKNILNIEDNASDDNDSKVESLKDNKQQCDKLNIEIDKLKYNYETKLQQMKNLKNNLQKEKLEFDSYSNDLRSKINKERNDIEKIQRDIDRKNDETRKKNMELDKKEKILFEQNDNCKNLENLIKEKNNKNLKDEKDLELAEYKKNIFYNELLDKNEEIENEKNKLNQQINDLENEKIEIFNNKNDIEQINREINLRMRCINDLNENNVVNEFNNITNKIEMKEKKEEIDSEYLNKINNKEMNINGGDKYDNFNKFKTNSFNSELYLLKLKNRMDANKIKLGNKYDITNKKFNIEKEKEFLMKSYENLNKIKK